jgi:hypothetical protein
MVRNLATFLTKDFEFNSDVKFSVKRFLAKFDAIFSLNQDRQFGHSRNLCSTAQVKSGRHNFRRPF